MSKASQGGTANAIPSTVSYIISSLEQLLKAIAFSTACQLSFPPPALQLLILSAAVVSSSIVHHYLLVHSSVLPTSLHILRDRQLTDRQLEVRMTFIMLSGFSVTQDTHRMDQMDGKKKA